MQKDQTKPKQGRPKMTENEKKKRATFSLPSEQIEFLKSFKNRSEFIESLIWKEISCKNQTN